MVEQEEKKIEDVIVVAQEGHQVLLDIDGRTLSIDCHESVNLSDMFLPEVIDRCSSLATSLKVGHLVKCSEDDKLTVDTVSPSTIQTLRPETASHIAAQYTQAERDVKRTNMEIQTRSNITAETRRLIEEQVQVSKDEIHRVDHKFSKKDDAAAKVEREMDSVPMGRQDAMSVSELSMNVSMDVPADEFNERQQEAKLKLDAAEDADEARAGAEIAQQEVAE